MYTGQVVEIPIGLDGLTGSKNFAKLTPANLLEANNISYESGTITREGGSTKYNASAISGAPSILGGWDWWPSVGTQRMIVATSAGAILKDSGDTTFSTTLASGLTLAHSVATFVEGGKEIAANNRKLFIFTGGSPVQVLAADGAVTANIIAPPADWSGTNQPIGGCLHEGRLWAWGNANDPHRVYASLNSNHEDFTTTPYSISVFSGEGERIVAGCSFKGMLILWKYPNGVYFIDTSSATSDEWRPVKITEAVGMASPRGFCLTDNDVLYMDKQGHIEFISATDEFGSLRSRNLTTVTDFDEFMRDNVNFSRFLYTHAVYYDAKREVHLAVASTGVTANNRRIVIDFNGAQPRFRFSDKDTCQSLWLRKDTDGIERLVSGDNLGFVWLLDQSTNNKDSAAYTSRFQTAHTDFAYADPALATKRKNADFLELIVEHRSASTLFVDFVWDGKVKQSIPFTMGGTLATWGGSTNWGSFKWGGSRIISKRKRVTGGGKRLSLIFRNSQANQDFSIVKALLHFRPGDERAA